MLLLLIFMVLQGCNFTKPTQLPLPPVTIITETIQLEIYQPPPPPEIQLDDVQWVVLTENNLEEKIAEIKQFTGTEFVIFGMTPQSYENMAYNLQEIRRYMRQQKEIILYYKEATKVKGAAGWLEENQDKQNNQIERTVETTQLTVSEPETSWIRRLIPGI